MARRVAIYLTHPEVVIDPAVPVPDWGLNDVGAARVAAAAERAMRRGEPLYVVSSAERKALETAWPFGAACRTAVEVVPRLHENDRSATGYLPPESFEAARVAFFTEPDRSYRGWETARAAQARCLTGVRACLARSVAPRVLFCGHGGVGALLMAALLGDPIGLEHGRGGGGHWFSFDPDGAGLLSDWQPIEALFTD